MERNRDMYDFLERASECYGLLQDELSRKIFWARLQCDFSYSPETTMELVRLGEQKKWLDALEAKIPDIAYRARKENKKIILYGTNATGATVAALFKGKDTDFYGFCGRRAASFPDGIMGKPVISPEYLFQHSEEFCVIIAASEAGEEIRSILKENHFPEGQILACFKPEGEVDHQYFDFPSLFRRGTAFVDGGCLDCRTSYLFDTWCEGEYSKIFAFEPDPISYSICERNLAQKEIKNCQLVRAGLSDHDGEVKFQTGLYGASHIIKGEQAVSGEAVPVPVTTIDNIVGEEKVGFIKMDIEGAELDALHGAENTITRDRPLLALSVYHIAGDMLAIMDYLHALIPEYRFWLRHYSVEAVDTVLYASIDRV